MKSLLIKLFVFSVCIMQQIGLMADKPLVVASASMIADMATNIGGQHIDVDLIVPIGGDPHIYEPTPDDVRLVRSANLILLNGLTFEGWINELIENSGTSASTIIVTKGIDILTSQQYKNSTDPHAWMTASNGKIYAFNIKKALQELDPLHYDFYEKNYNSYAAQLEDLDQYIKQKIIEIPESKRILVTSHDAFQYYGRRYGVRLEAIMGISTEAEAQTSDIIRVNRVIKESGIPAIFVESTINPKLISQLAEDNHIKIGGKLYADSLGDKDSPADTYINMLKYNTDTIVNALLGESEDADPSQSTGQSYLYLWIFGGVLLISSILLIMKINR